MKRRHLPTAIVLIAAFGGPSSVFAAPEWQVMLSAQSSTVLLPQLPTTGYSLSVGTCEISDSASASVHFELTPASGSSAAWLERGGVLQPMAQPGVVGATGPGRVGVESTHVFRLIGEIDSNAQDQRIFAARAGDPAQSFETASHGIWRSSGTSNIEVARSLTDGPLGPGIGVNWFFIPDPDFSPFGNAADLSRAHALPNGQVLFDAVVRPPPGEPFTARRALVRHTPGLGNLPCAVVRVSDPSLSPGVLIGDFFETIGRAASSADGEIYAAGQATATSPTIEIHQGIWKFCEGAPQIKALSAHTGALGPNIAGSPTAIFNQFRQIAPTGPGSFYFSGEGSPTFKGVFHHRNGQNRPILLNDMVGALGPGVAGFTFRQVIDFETLSAGQFGVLYAFIRNPASGVERTGLWRLRPDASPEPILIVGDSGAYAPSAGRLWDSVTAFHILENGVVLAVAATTTPPSTLRRLSVWRLRPGRAPEEILKAGDMVRYPSVTGVQMRSVRSVGDLFVLSASDGQQNYAGDDSWVSASGSVLAEVQLEGMEGFIFPTRYVRAQVSDLNVLFEDGFEP